MRSFQNYSRVQSLQWIAPTGEKLFLYGGAMKGGVIKIGADAPNAWFCEGYATGLTLQLAIQRGGLKSAQVWICFSASNMQRIASETWRSFNQSYVFADHDRVNKLTGERAGEKAADHSGLPWCQSPAEGEDANDLMLRDGIWSVARLMKGVQF